jgi:hypothetical protein
MSDDKLSGYISPQGCEFHNIDVFLVLVPRDIKERGRDLDQVLNQYMYFVKPAFEEFCSPVSILVS